MIRATSACLALCAALLLLQRVEAQPAQTARPPAPAAAEKPPAADPLGRSTPDGTVNGLQQAAAQGNLDRAAEFLESDRSLSARRVLAEKLWVVLDRKLHRGLGRPSTQPAGNLDDGRSDDDLIGVIESSSGAVDVLVKRVQRGRNDPIWLFSSSTLEQIPRLYDEIQPPWIERYVPAPLQTQWLSVPLYRWIALAVLLPLIFMLAAASARVLTAVLGPQMRRLTRGRAELVSLGPLRLLMLSLFFFVSSMFGFSLATRSLWQRVGETLLVMALCWLAMRLTDFGAQLSLDRLNRSHRTDNTALVRLLSRLLKAVALIVALLVFLFLLDVDLTAALTGLGVGGLAIGFGAQKTIKNLFGGIMVISDKPVNVGDMCKAGEFFGMVEDIGIRSTRIRTLNRTVVSVPNGLLATMSLENFQLRDRILFQQTVGLALQTTAAQLRLVLAGIRRMLDAHPKVEAEARARFVRFTGVSLELEIFAYVLESEQPAFLAVQEDLLLGIMDIIDSSGTTVAVAFQMPPMLVKS